MVESMCSLHTRRTRGQCGGGGAVGKGGGGAGASNNFVGDGGRIAFAPTIIKIKPDTSKAKCIIVGADRNFK